MRILVYFTVFAALFYNAVLALINANVTYVSMAYVMSVELVIMILSGVVIVYTLQKSDALKRDIVLKNSFICLCLFVLLYVVNCAFAISVGGTVSAKPIRDTLVVFVFMMLGLAAAHLNINPRWLLTTSAALVLAVLLVELLDTRLYIRLFNVASYWSHTRGDGVEVEAGVFRTAMSFKGRFSFGFRQAQRLSSLFLEQTTHANFAVIATIFLAGFWKKFGKISRALLVTTVLLIILGTDSRQAAAICLFIAAGYAFFPKMHRASLYMYMPLALMFMLFFFYDPDFTHRTSDTFGGRLTYSISRLFGSDLQAALGMRLGERVFDSGYTYLVYTQSLLGFLAFLVLLPSALPYRTAAGRRFSHAVMLCYMVNLSVSGSTIFSIKSSALLWFLIGIVGATEALYVNSGQGAGEPDLRGRLRLKRASDDLPKILRPTPSFPR